jgi:hypothetical protein
MSSSLATLILVRFMRILILLESSTLLKRSVLERLIPTLLILSITTNVLIWLFILSDTIKVIISIILLVWGKALGLSAERRTLHRFWTLNLRRYNLN